VLLRLRMPDGHKFAQSHQLVQLATELQKCLLSPFLSGSEARAVPCSITVTAQCIGRIPLLEAGVPSAASPAKVPRGPSCPGAACCWSAAIPHSYRAAKPEAPRHSQTFSLVCLPGGTLRWCLQAGKRVPGAGSLKACVMWGRPGLRKI